MSNIRYLLFTLIYPGVAQLVACLTGGQEAAGSSPVTRTIEPLNPLFKGFSGYFFAFILNSWLV